MFWNKSSLLKALLILPLCVSFVGCGEDSAEAVSDVTPGMTEQALSEGDVYLWQAKLLGTHNSYSKRDPATWPSEGGPDHVPGLADQLSWGIRVLEIDIVREDGWVSHGGSPYMEVHCGDIDTCLAQVNGWSSANPSHTPIVIFIEFSSYYGLDTGFQERRTRTLPTYDRIKLAYGRQVPDFKKITSADAYRSINSLRGKIALAVYRKRASWDPLLPFLEAHDPDGARDGFLANSKLFVAAKGLTDGDFAGSLSDPKLRFIKADNADPAWEGAWKTAPIFTSVNVCKDHDCNVDAGDIDRTWKVFYDTSTNGIMTNEVPDLGAWLGSNRDVYFNYARLGMAVPFAELPRSFESYNFPGEFMRHKSYLGERTPLNTFLDRADGAFRLRPGLANPGCVSFESTNLPGYFLRHQGSRIKLHARSNDSLYLNDATFCMRPGNADGALTSFEAVNFPGHFIRHAGGHLYIGRNDGSSLFKADSTFRVGPWRSGL